MDHLARHVALRYIDATLYREAKSRYLKAIDFTIGLLKRLTKLGKQLPGNSNAEVMHRLTQLRALAQGGVRLDTLLDNKQAIAQSGQMILNKLERDEAAIIPAERDLALFVREYPNTAQAAADAQAKVFLAKIVAKLGVEQDEAVRRMLIDEDFMTNCYNVLLPDLKSVESKLTSTLNGKFGGQFLHRVKEAHSAFGKQNREGRPVPFIYFKDLVGTMAVVPNVRSLAAAAAQAQREFDVLDKKNYFLKAGGYNAINYNLGSDGIVTEFQLKTEINADEAHLSHDLIYAKEKAIADLSDQEKHLVAIVIDVSTQLTMREWHDEFGVEVRLASEG